MWFLVVNAVKPQITLQWAKVWAQRNFGILSQTCDLCGSIVNDNKCQANDKKTTAQRSTQKVNFKNRLNADKSDKRAYFYGLPACLFLIIWREKTTKGGYEVTIASGLN